MPENEPLQGWPPESLDAEEEIVESPKEIPLWMLNKHSRENFNRMKHGVPAEEPVADDEDSSEEE